jgi:hypothetical protein
VNEIYNALSKYEDLLLCKFQELLSHLLQVKCVENVLNLLREKCLCHLDHIELKSLNEVLLRDQSVTLV